MLFVVGKPSHSCLVASDHFARPFKVYACAVLERQSCASDAEPALLACYFAKEPSHSCLAAGDLFAQPLKVYACAVHERQSCASEDACKTACSSP